MQTKKTLSLLLATMMMPAALAADIPDWQKAEITEVWTPVPEVVTVNDKNIPSDAIVLFDGSSLDNWQSATGDGPAKWQVKDGAMTVAAGTGDIKTKAGFCDVQLHVEWKTPTKITNDKGETLTGQGRSNSGVFFQQRYEIQVLDSYENKTYPNGQAGAIYKQHIPLANPTKAPGEWQTYDIIYTAPVFDEAGKLKSKARITALLNGVLVQNNAEIQGTTAWIGAPQYSAHGCDSIRLQDHGNPVSFRNIWLRKL